MAGLGEFCQETGVSVDALATGLLPKIQDLKKGLIHELNAYRKAHDVSWKDYYGWIEQMCENPAILPTLETFKVYVGRLEKKRSELLRNKNQNDLMLLMAQPFCCTKKVRSYVSLSDIPPSKHAESTFDFEVLQKVNAEIAAELHEANAVLHDEQNKTEKLATKLNKLSVRNVNKKLRRRDDRIHSAECQIYSLTQNIEAKTETVEKLERDLESATQANHRSRSKVYRSSKQVEVVQMGMADIQSKLAHLEKQFDSRVSSLMNEISQLKRAVNEAQQQWDQIQERLDEIKQKHCKTKEHEQKYLDTVRQCCIELLSMNVGVKQVKPVIRSVLLNIAGMEADDLPSTATLVRMLSEMKGLAYQQFPEVLFEHDNLTLHSDGTSKFGHHYGSFQVSTEGTAYSLGLSDMLTGSAQQTLDTLKQILSDLESVAGKGVQTSLLSKIKNTMSDRHIVEKKFNHLLEEYRLEILPDVIDAWDDLSEEEKQQIASLNNFFCEMHLLVGMADTAARVLLQWEKVHIEGTAAHPGDIIVQKSESGTVRLVRTACKALSKHGSEQSGVYQPFTAYLSSHGVTRNPLASFRGNRFNILFYDAGALFTIDPLVEKFFMEVWQTPNQLLRAVLADIQVPQFRSGCKALGLINKMITGPLWRVLESHEISILEMNDRFLHLKSYLDKWSLDAMPLLCGEAVVYPNFPPSHDTILFLIYWFLQVSMTQLLKKLCR